MIVKNTFLSAFFGPVSVFPKFQLAKKYPLTFIADVGLEKVVLRVETFFGTMRFFRKIEKTVFENEFFVFTVGEKVVSQS